MHRWVTLAVLVLAAWACSHPPARTATETPTPDRPAEQAAVSIDAGPAALSPVAARSYFASGAAAEGLKKFRLAEFAEARAAFARALDQASDKQTRARLELMMALCDDGTGNFDDAAAGLIAAGSAVPVIADWLAYRAARALAAAGKDDRALAMADQVPPSSIAGAEAELLVGQILRRKQDLRRIADHYRNYLAARPEGPGLSEARYGLAEAIERLGEQDQASALYRTITVSDPLSRWAELASARLDARLSGLPAGQRTAQSQLDAAELIERGHVYFDNMRNEESEADFEAALDVPSIDEQQRCEASFFRAQSVYKQRNRRRAAPLFDDAIDACQRANNRDLIIKAAYQAGRSYANLRKRLVAIERYELAEEQAARQHSYGDDARLRQAEEHHDLGNSEKVTELLSSIPELYPDGDMRAEAMWRLAWRDYKDGDLDGARAWLQKQIDTMPIDHHFWAEGQAQYWMGRIFDRQKQPDDAATWYQKTIELYPLSYYTLLALNRLREGHPEVFARVAQQIAAPPAGTSPDAPDFAFKPRQLYGSPGFARAMEFLRLGLGEPAARELGRLGLEVPQGKQPVSDPDRRDALWALAFLLDQAGQYADSHWMTRWHILDYKRSWPVGPARARWRIAYPKAYWPLLDRHARQHGYPTELLMAFVREESAFDPHRESFANAIGLTQMIFPTARRFAAGTGIEVSRATLRDPESNVTIGGRFLAFLYQRFDRFYALIPPSYNAGEGATDRWLRLRGDWAMDEFAEEIPYDETRGYSKRVLHSFFVYAYLADGTIPALPNRIPRKLIPRRR